METFKIYDKFGSFCGNGTAAKEYADENIVPLLKKGNRVTIDLNGVKMVNSSFINSLIFNTYGYEVVDNQVTFLTNDSLIQSMIDRGIKLLENTLPE